MLFLSETSGIGLMFKMTRLERDIAKRYVDSQADELYLWLLHVDSKLKKFNSVYFAKITGENVIALVFAGGRDNEGSGKSRTTCGLTMIKDQGAPFTMLYFEEREGE